MMCSDKIVKNGFMEGKQGYMKNVEKILLIQRGENVQKMKY
jgi:hypothetical protein